MLRKPLAPQKTETGYCVEITFLDAAPPNQLIGLDEKSFRMHLLQALESVLQNILEDQDVQNPWQEVGHISEFSLNWETTRPSLQATVVDFSFSEVADSNSVVTMQILSVDRKWTYAQASAVIENITCSGKHSEKLPTQGGPATV